MRKLSIGLALLTGVLLAWLPTAAAADMEHSVGLFVGYLSPTGDWTGDDVDGMITVELDSTTGYGLAYRYRFSDAFSLGASLLTAKHDVQVSVAGLGSVTVGEAKA